MRTTIIKVAQLVAIVLLGVYVSGCSARMSGGFHAGLPGTVLPRAASLLPPSSELKPAKDFALGHSTTTAKVWPNWSRPSANRSYHVPKALRAEHSRRGDPASTLVVGAICGMTLAALLYPVLIAAMSISPPSI